MAIDVTAQILYWRTGSTDDLEAARALLNVGKIRQAGFFAHLSIEKAIKACVAAHTRNLPPRSHDLLFLVERTGVRVSELQLNFLARIQVYCMEGRYPTELPPPPDAKTLEHDIQEAAEMIQWWMNQLNKP